MIFLDGVGIGKEDYEFNPFFKYGFNTFQTIFGRVPSLKYSNLMGYRKYLFPVDANLKIKGLPQSGTGQSSLFCGFNAPKLIGKHFGPFPYSTIIPVIKEKHLLVHYKRKGSYFANAYPKPFFDYLKSGKTRLGVTATCCRLNKIKFNKPANVRNGSALTAEITNDRWNRKLDYKLPSIKPQTAARRLLRMAAKYKFTLYEFYLLDHLGHLRLKNDFEEIYNLLDVFLFTILTELNENNLTVIICSDHGNFEDLSTKSHTRNPALAITAGRYAEELFNSVKSLNQFKPAIIKYCR